MHSGRFLSYSRKRKISQNDHSFSLVVIRYNLLSLDVIFCPSLSLALIHCHSLSLVATRCHSLYHSLSFVVFRCITLSLAVPLVITRCHSMYHSSVFLKTLFMYMKIMWNYSEAFTSHRHKTTIFHFLTTTCRSYFLVK